jgi:hypothetical protein
VVHRVQCSAAMRLLVCLLFAACSAETMQLAPDAPAAAADIPDIRCTTAPSLPGRELRHAKNEVVVEMGEPRHRGIDLIAAESDATQTFAGALAYSDLDKALEDEDAELFACTGDGWQTLGTARTDGDGRFSLTVSGNDRLGVGLRDVYAAAADGTGVWFLALVAPDGARVMISDIDGTLTSSENAFPTSVVVGTQVGVQPHAPAMFVDAAAAGITPIFLTARGDLYTHATRQWLSDRGFPRAPLRLAQPVITLPGSATVAFKRSVAAPLVERFDIVRAIGNRASDIDAYSAAGVAADHIFIKLPEFSGEVAQALANGKATGFASYDDLPRF